MVSKRTETTFLNQDVTRRMIEDLQRELRQLTNRVTTIVVANGLKDS